MEDEIGTATTYGSVIQFMRTFFEEKQNEEMNQETKAYAKLQLGTKRYMKENCMKCGQP